MSTVNLDSTDLVEATGIRFAFPISSATGTADSAVVYMELEPGGELPLHTDSAEELLLVLEGEVEATVGEDTARAAVGTIVVVPALVTHGLSDVGFGAGRAVGFFASSTNVAVIPDPAPTGDQVFVIGAPFPLAMRLPELAGV